MDVIIRTANIKDAKDIATVHTRAWHESYSGLIDQSFLQNTITLERNLPRRIAALEKAATGYGHPHYVAVLPDQGIVGFACCGPWREAGGWAEPEGEISAIYLLDSAKRKGIGKKLFLACVDNLLQRNMKTMGLWVLQDNMPARKFYEFMGGRCLKEDTPLVFGEKEYLECAYFYDDLTRFKT
ncbi:MAG: GNAT family N-acetyltransferase [Alphaproteobacteria bacterium]|nr:MAG: GNAT family N-acetyltransferase [Alphaproteobacteria bacterium]